MDKQRPGPSCILAPCSRIGYKPFHASHKGRSCSFYFWVGQPENLHVRLGTFHCVVGYYPALLFQALDQRWLRSALGCRGVMLMSRGTTRYLVAIGGNRFKARNIRNSTMSLTTLVLCFFISQICFWDHKYVFHLGKVFYHLVKVIFNLFASMFPTLYPNLSNFRTSSHVPREMSHMASLVYYKIWDFCIFF
jgi:hypothetical protein